MNSSQPRINGLTSLILDSLVDLTPMVYENQEAWDDRLLREVEDQIHHQLAPKSSGRERLVFDLVFKRSFAEAKDLLSQILALSSLEQAKHMAQSRVMA